MKATITYTDDGQETIAVNGHEIQVGGVGDGYCYAHQSFDCLDNLTDVERDALESAR